ncbi:MAG TPA: Ig-like domain-containing protein [Vicinamibacterales bacterium]|nr:Ig-like domain-containing protein [Vicinamibacterales bacterium]
MKFTTLAVFVVVAIVAVGCGQSTPAPTAPTTATVSAVTVTSATQSSSSFQLTATARLSDGSTRDVTSLATWSSSNTSLATVSSTGLVTVLGAGEIDVKATYQGVAGSVHLLVANLPVTSLTLANVPTVASVNFQAGASAHLSDGSVQDVTRSATWASSDTGIATVSSTGFVSIVANGEVDIRATYQGLTASSHMKVTLPTTYTVSGVVTDASASGKVLAGVRVQTVGAGFVLTDAQGVYRLAVTGGRVLLEFSMTGYQVLEKEIDVNGDTQLNVTLMPQS